MFLTLDKLRENSNQMKRLVLTLILALSAAMLANAQTPTYDYSIGYADRDTGSLVMDVYMPVAPAEKNPCMIYVYGGGFVENNLRSHFSRKLCRRFADAGYVTLAVDYRLGLSGIRFKNTAQMVKPLEKAVKMASEDLFSVVEYILANADDLKIDPSKIIISGSSAGAITVLQTDYELCNRTQLASAMPEDFRFAGVISYAGAVFSREGKCDYKVHDPAPTFFLHGTADKLVTYNKIQLFRTGFFGSESLVRRFEKFGWPYLIARFEGQSHEVAGYNQSFFDETLWFIEKYVNQGRRWQIDLTCEMPEMKGVTLNWKPDEIYK